jgi:catechol 2,3-dioxygenase-like lactoylglutathione lyase family enzyme
VTDLVETALFTDDVEAVKAFYGRLVGTAPVVEWPGGAIYEAGGVKLLVHERAAAPEGGPPNEDHFALGVGDLDRVASELEAEGFSFLVEPRDFRWGRSAYLRDPDGRLVELSQT